MKLELPEFQRCCCFFPLRYGIVAWAVVKLIISLSTNIPIIEYTVHQLQNIDDDFSPLRVGTVAIYMLLGFVDIPFFIVFLVSAQQKSAAIMRFYYIFKIVTSCVCLFLFFIIFIVDMNMYGSMMYGGGDYISRFLNMMRFRMAMMLSTIGMEIYYILLVRSEMKKLTRNCNFRFENRACEDECAMEVGIKEQEYDTVEIGNGDQPKGIDDKNQGNEGNTP